MDVHNVSAWQGVFPYLATPLTHADEVDREALRRLVRFCVNEGCHGITPLGSSGELPYLESGDRRATIETVVEEVAGKVPVLVGVGGFSSRQVLDQINVAERCGVDGIVCVLQAYFPLDDEEIVSFFEMVAGNTELPLVAYHNPTLCHVRFSPAVVDALAEIPGVLCIKEASGNSTNVATWAVRYGGKLDVFSSTSLSPTAAMLLGAKGWMSGPAGAFPAESVAIFEHCREGRWEEARNLERALEPALGLFRRLGPGRAMKAILLARGFRVGQPVHPLRPIDEKELEEAKRAIASVISDTALATN
jgi:4-hydroxy-tetrahydrodipicolinate synthase